MSLSYLVSAAFNIVGNFFLIPHLDEIGASFTTLGAEWLVVLIQFSAMYRILGRIGIRQIAFKKLIAGAVMSAAILPLPKLLGSTLPVMLLQIAAGAAVYFVAAFKTGAVTKEEVELIPKGDLLYRLAVKLRVAK